MKRSNTEHRHSDYKRQKIKEHGQYRSPQAQYIHTLVFRCMTKSQKNSIIELERELETCSLNTITETGFNGNSILHDIVSLPFKIIDDPKKAEKRSLILWNKVHPICKNALAPDVYKSFLATTTTAGFSLLQQAAASKDAAIFKAALKATKEAFKDDPQGLKILLAIINKDGFSLLQSAAVSENAVIFETALEATKEAFSDDPKGLKNLLATITKDQFSLLQSATISGMGAIFKAALKATKEAFSDDPKGLKNILTNITKDRFSLLQISAGSGNEIIFGAALEATKKAFRDDSEGLRDLLATITKDQFSLLQEAAASGNEIIFTDVLHTTQEAFKDDSARLKNLLANITKDGFSLLQSAAKSRTEAIFKAALHATKDAFKDDPKALVRHVKHSNDNNFNMLHQICGTNMPALVQIAVDWIKEVEIVTGDNNILANMASDKTSFHFVPMANRREGNYSTKVEDVIQKILSSALEKTPIRDASDVRRSDTWQSREEDRSRQYNHSEGNDYRSGHRRNDRASEAFGTWGKWQ